MSVGIHRLKGPEVDGDLAQSLIVRGRSGHGDVESDLAHQTDGTFSRFKIGLEVLDESFVGDSNAHSRSYLAYRHVTSLPAKANEVTPPEEKSGPHSRRFPPTPFLIWRITKMMPRLAYGKPP